MKALFALFIFPIISLLHPFHVAIFELNHSDKKQNIEITAKLFIDDLELALKTETGSKVDLLKDYKNLSVKEAINKYISKRLKIGVNGKTTTLVFVGAEPEGDSMWCYFEVNGIKKIKSIQVNNTVLTELYDDQTNLVHININGETKSMKLRKDAPLEKLNF